MDPRTRHAGFTLIELLIATAILAMMLTLASYSFALFTRHWDGLQGGFYRARGEVQRVDLLDVALGSTIPWVVRESTGRIGFYFLGREEGFTFVSASPIFDDRGPAVVRILKEPDPAGDGWQLAYEEAPLRGIRLQDAEQVLPFNRRVVLMTGLSELDFAYFGWLNASERNMPIELGAVPPQWYEEFDGLTRAHHPLKVRLTVDGLAIPITFPAREAITLGRVMEPE